MDNASKVVNELLNALDIIARAATKNEPYATSYILGVCEKATKNAHLSMVRNADGSLVVKGEK